MSVATGSGPGEALKAVREEREIRLEEIADRLRLKQEIITALEDDRYEQLPAPAFVRGYIRSYAALLDLDSKPLLSQYERIAPADPELKNLPKPDRSSPKRASMLIGVGIFVALLLLVLTAVWVFGSSSDHWGIDRLIGKKPLEATSVTFQPASVDKSSQQISNFSAELIPVKYSDAPIAEQLQPMPVNTESTLATPVTSPANNPIKPVTATSLPSSPVRPEVVAGEDQLVFHVNGESWVEVLDANNNRLLYKMVAAGSHDIRVTGQAPFDVILGDAGHVSVRINGQVFDHSRYIRANLSARFKLGNSE